MRKVFEPYTKERAKTILRRYFSLTVQQAIMELLRLEACAKRDGLEVGKYLYTWECKMRQGLTGNIDELHILYPFKG